MPLTAVGLVLASCGLHALWNLFVKQGRDKVAFTALFLLAVPVLFAPVFLALLPTHLPSTAGWLCVVATGIVYTAYFLGLARAYEVSDLSVAYPLSRGLGPALTVLWDVLLLGERPTERGWLGIALTLAGAWMLSWHQGQAVHWRSLFAPPLRPAWFVAAMYSAYSVIDKLAVSVFTVHPAVYIYAAYTVCADSHRAQTEGNSSTVGGVATKQVAVPRYGCAQHRGLPFGAFRPFASSHAYQLHHPTTNRWHSVRRLVGHGSFRRNGKMAKEPCRSRSDGRCRPYRGGMKAFVGSFRVNCHTLPIG